MNQKSISILVVIAVLLIPFTSQAKWPDKEKIKSGIVGSWAFNRFWGVYQTPAEKKSDAPADLYLIYTFYADGKARIWSMDKGKYNVQDKKYTWSVIPVKSTEGKEAFAVKLVDPSIDPANQTEIENAKSEFTFILTGVTKKFMWWIKAAEDGSFSEKEYFAEFNKANVVAPTY